MKTLLEDIHINKTAVSHEPIGDVFAQFAYWLFGTVFND
jgi:hypothetical protein